MAEMDVLAEYERVLQEQRERFMASQSLMGMEQRSHPRLKVESKDLWISTVPVFDLVDMSASGLAIRSNQPLKVGELIRISLGNTVSVEAEVVGCHMDMPPDEYTDGEFRIQCRFLEDLRGMEIFIRAIRANA
jgi:hypothetical protein